MKQVRNNKNPAVFSQTTSLEPVPFYMLSCCLALLFLSGCQEKHVSVFCIGDSTMSSYDLQALDEQQGGDNYPLRGWAMALSAYLNDKAEVRNEAVSGRSSKNFISEGYWDNVRNELRKGDFLIIQFGHNDEKKDDPNRYTQPYGEYTDNLIRFIQESETLGAHPILATPIARRNFDAEGQLVDTHGEYVNATRDAAKKTGVPLIDLNKMTMEYLTELGVEDSKKLFLHVKPGVFKKLPDGKTDDTHLSKQGACAVSQLFMQGISKSDSPLKKYQLGDTIDCLSKIK